MQAIRAARKSDHDLSEEAEAAARDHGDQAAAIGVTSEILARSDPPPPSLDTLDTGEVPALLHAGERDEREEASWGSESDSFGLPTPRVTPALRSVLVHADDAESASILALSDTAPRPIVRIERESSETPAAEPVVHVPSTVRPRVEPPAAALRAVPDDASDPAPFPYVRIVAAIGLVLTMIVSYWFIGRG